jgi:hypothetical protein
MPLPPTISFQEIASIPLLLWGTTNNLLPAEHSPWLAAARVQIETAAEEANIRLNIAYEVNDSLSASQMLDLVESEQGATILPFHLVSGANRLPVDRYKVQFIVDPTLSVPLSVATRSNNSVTKAARIVSGLLERITVERLDGTRQEQLGLTPPRRGRTGEAGQAAR